MIHRLSILAASIALALPSIAQAAKPLFTSKVIHADPVEIKVDVKGAKELFLVVTDGGDGFAADWAEWMEPVLVKADGTKVKLTELKPKGQQVGWGQLGVNARPDGQQPMRVKDRMWRSGFGTHAPSMLTFDLPADVVAFEGAGRDR
jgi:hypothetical protein